MDWTDDNTANLRAWWAEGVPCILIAQRLGTTANAVIGKARRLNLPTHAHHRGGGRPKGQANRPDCRRSRDIVG